MLIDYLSLPHGKLSELLRKKKKEHKLNSSGLARKVEKTRSMISQIEMGKLKVPRYQFSTFMDFYLVNREELESIDAAFVTIMDEPDRDLGPDVLTREDIVWLLKVYDELAKPMTIGQAMGLLKLRHC